MLENLRRKSLVKTYNDPIHQVYFDHSWAIYLDSCSIAQHIQKLSKEKIVTPFPKRSFTTPNPKCFTIPTGFWGVVETLGKVKFNMIYCPKGTFTMGHKDEDDNQPRQETIEMPFLLGETEVTQELYEKVMGNNRSHNTTNSQNPTESISWEFPIWFCNELSRLQGLELCYTKNLESLGGGWDRWKCDFSKNGYRLPREKEWEYAAKAGTKNKWAGTDKEEDLDKYAWFNGHWQKGTTHPVKSKLPNEWGFYDMSGNVKEWCWDLYDSSGNTSSLLVVQDHRVFRGGGERDKPQDVSSASRNCFSSNTAQATLGFRICRSFVN